jgi:hypothetical protein
VLRVRINGKNYVIKDIHYNSQFLSRPGKRSVRLKWHEWTEDNGFRPLIQFTEMFPLFFDGASLEKTKRTKVQKNPDVFWSVWQSHSELSPLKSFVGLLPSSIQDLALSVIESFDTPTPPWREYREIIHPAIVEAAKEILQAMHLDHPVVVEICGGDGSLATDILKTCNQCLDYLLLEYNRLAIMKADYAFQHIPSEQKVVAVQTDVVAEERYFADKLKQKPLEEESVDLILGSGALTAFVLANKEEALQVLKKCNFYLKPGGFMIFSGHAASLLDANDFSEKGFIVRNMTLPNYTEQFYIIQKEGRE